MVQLHEIWPNGFYCGPSVIAAVTGADCREVRGWVNAVRGRRPNIGILGMTNRHLLGTLASRGYSLVSLNVPQPTKRWQFGERPILEAFADTLTDDTRYIVNVTGHYIAMLNGIVFDNRNRFGTTLPQHHSRRQRVWQAWRVQ